VGPIRIPVTLSPHIVKGEPRGYYALFQRIFPRGAPILVKQQFLGFTQSLLVTACHPPQCETLLHMAIVCPVLGGNGVSWLHSASVFPMGGGFKAYLSRSILPAKLESKKVVTTGLFCRSGDIFFVQLPILTGDVLLRKKEIGT
jgi:hypothetical protein